VEGGFQESPLDDYWETPTNWKYGVDEHDELAVFISPWISVDHVTGLGDSGLTWRHRFVDAQGEAPAVAWQGSLKLPTADEDRGLGPGHADAFGALSLAGALGSFGWTVYAQLGALGQGNEAPDLEEDLALVGAWSLDARNSLFAELSDRRVHEQDSVVDQLRV